MDLKALSSRLADFRDRRNWKRFHNPKDLALSLSVEASELLECFQWREDSQSISEEERKRMGSEVADILFYLLFFCDAAGIELGEAVDSKFTRNEERFSIEECRQAGLKPPTDT